MASSWNVTGPSQSIPSQSERALDLLRRLDDLAARVGVLDPQQALAAATAREQPVEEERVHAADVEETRRRRRHADADAHAGDRSQAAACPRGGTPSSVALLFGAHVSTAGGISTAIDRARSSAATPSRCSRRARRCGSRRSHARGARAVPHAASRRRAIRSVVCHALYLVNLASTDRAIRKKSVTALRASLETAAAIGADGVIFHVGSHLGHRARRLAPADRAAAPRAPRADDGRPLAPARELGRRRRHDRPLGRRARRDRRPKLDHHPRLGVCLDSCHWWVSGVDVTDPDALDDGARASSTSADRASTASAASTSTTRRSASARTATGTRRSASGRSATGWRRSSPTPRSRSSRRSSRPRGPDGTYVGELALLKELHRKGMRRRRRSRQRRRQSWAREPRWCLPHVDRSRLLQSGGYSTVAKTRKLGLASGSSWNSGLRHPSSSPRCS